MVIRHTDNVLYVYTRAYNALTHLSVINVLLLQQQQLILLIVILVLVCICMIINVCRYVPIPHTLPLALVVEYVRRVIHHALPVIHHHTAYHAPVPFLYYT